MSIPFADTVFAEEYFADRAFVDKWLDCQNKAAFLATASRMIADFCTFTDANEDLIDYTDGVITAPEWLKRATCEQALYLVNLGKDPTQADKKTTLGIVSTDGTVFDKSFSADIISPNCRRIIITNGGSVSPLAQSKKQSISHGRITR